MVIHDFYKEADFVEESVRWMSLFDITTRSYLDALQDNKKNMKSVVPFTQILDY